MATRLSPARMAALSALIWPPEPTAPDGERQHTYMLIDAARRPGIHLSLAEHQAELHIRSLYQGETAEQFADVSPYVARLDPEVDYSHYLVDQGWGDAWGLFVHSTLDIDGVRRHFRKFTIVNTEDGKTLLFRFYDPRVLCSFLPTCDDGQLSALFGGILRYLAEDEDGACLRHFELTDGGLQAIRHPIRE